MPDATPTSTPSAVRSFEAGLLALGVGAVLLFVSLFLEWYRPNVDAWEIFEVWDLVLALLAAGALVGVASRFGVGPPRPPSWIVGPAVGALVIVLFALLDPPPLTNSIDGDPGTGLWLALVAAVLMVVGVVMSVARISVAFSAGPRSADPVARRPGTVADPAVADEPATTGAPERPSGLFARRTPPLAEPLDPADSGPDPSTDPTRRI